MNSRGLQRERVCGTWDTAAGQGQPHIADRRNARKVTIYNRAIGPYRLDIGRAFRSPSTGPSADESPPPTLLAAIHITLLLYKYVPICIAWGYFSIIRKGQIYCLNFLIKMRGSTLKEGEKARKRSPMMIRKTTRIGKEKKICALFRVLPVQAEQRALVPRCRPSCRLWCASWR